MLDKILGGLGGGILGNGSLMGMLGMVPGQLMGGDPMQYSLMSMLNNKPQGQNPQQSNPLGLLQQILGGLGL